MSDIIYVENELNGMEVLINDIEQEVTPEGLIFVRNGQDEIKAYVADIVKPDIDTYAEEQKTEAAEFMAQQTDAAKSELSANVATVQKPALDAYTEVKKTELDAYEQSKEGELGDYAATTINTMTSLKNAAATSEANAASSAESALSSATGAANTVNGFDAHAAEKQSAFDANATAQTQAANQAISEHKADLEAEFDAHAAEKQSAVDASAAAAKTSENNAKASELACEDVLERLGTVIKIKGRVDGIDDLPSTGNLDGDAYLVGSAGLEEYAEYYWFENHWEFLGTTGTKLAWGTITGDISAQADLQSALNAQTSALSAQTSALNTHTGNKSNPHGVTKAQVGLGNCDNTSDVNKPVSTAVQNALNLKANLASPAFSGTPTVPTAAVSTNNTQAVNTQWFNQKIQVVSALPSSPNSNVFYFIPE